MSDAVSTLVGVISFETALLESPAAAQAVLPGRHNHEAPFLRLVGGWTPEDELPPSSCVEFSESVPLPRRHWALHRPRRPSQIEARLERLVEDLDRETTLLLKKIEAAIDAAQKDHDV